MGINKTIQKYLSVYAEPEQQTITKLEKSYDFVIVIPICNEPNDCLQEILSNNKSASVLAILVINSPLNHEKSQLWQNSNHLFINHLRSKYKLINNINNHEILQFSNSIDLLIIDCNSKGQQLPEKKGVGLARKIGADLAVKLYTQGCIKFSWVFSTDADVILPINYFQQIQMIDKNTAAIVDEFDHYSDDKQLNQNQFLYDMKLRYYQSGVSYAGINYNYIPLGSTLIVNMLSYAQVRGFPIRNAGEDFYLLNKLAKVGSIHVNSAIVILIKSRYSDRVPFGTGPALNIINNSNEYKYYNPICFILLKHWFDFLNEMWHENKLIIKSPENKQLFDLYNYLKCKELFQSVSRQITSEKLWHNFIHQWLDAFKTLKVIHYFDKQHPRLDYHQLLEHKSFVKLSDSNLLRHISTYEQN